MIKSELVLHIASANPHLYQRDVENIVNAILREITNAMAKGDRVELRGFGAFSVKHRPARNGRNPRTGADFCSTAPGAPVRGLLPLGVGRCLTEKAPKPRNSTRSPLAMALVISPRIALTMFSTSR